MDLKGKSNKSNDTFFDKVGSQRTEQFIFIYLIITSFPY